MDSPEGRGPRDLAPVLGALPLFPLPTVLFPGALMPLHIFEPRYRAMTADARPSFKSTTARFTFAAALSGLSSSSVSKRTSARSRLRWLSFKGPVALRQRRRPRAAALSLLVDQVEREELFGVNANGDGVGFVEPVLELGP